MTATATPKITAPSLTEDDFDRLYIPLENQFTKDGTTTFETYGDEFNHVQNVFDTDPQTVWTILEVDGAQYIDAGFHHVNRLGYIITREPWTTGTESIPREDISGEAVKTAKDYFDCATYSPEDNKIRLYTNERLPEDIYARVKALKFKYAPKQKLFFARWTVMREDYALEMTGQILPEQTTLAERASAKIERLHGYAQNRANDADIFERAAQNLAQGFADGQPILRGHHSQRKAERDHKKMKSAQAKAVKSHATARYHLYKAEGVASHAERKNDSRVRAGRIKALFADLRSYQRGLSDAAKYLALWESATTADEIDRLTNSFHTARRGDYDAVRNGTLERETCRLENIERFKNSLAHRGTARVIEHILSRLSYEYAYMPEVRLFEGDLTPVILQTFARTHGADKPKVTAKGDSFILTSNVPLPRHISDSNSLELEDYQWRVLMQDCKYSVEIKARRKTTSTRTKNPLLNPSPEDAEKLQELWNLQMQLYCTRASRTPKEAKPIKASQKGYSQKSKGSYALCKSVEISAEGGQVDSRYSAHDFSQGKPAPAFRVRIYTGDSEFYKASRVVFITDKNTHPLPLDFDLLKAALLEQIEDAAKNESA